MVGNTATTRGSSRQLSLRERIARIPKTTAADRVGDQLREQQRKGVVRHDREQGQQQEGRDERGGRQAAHADDPPVLEHHRHLPAPVLVVLAEERAERPPRRVLERDRRVADDPAAREPQPEVELVVLVADERLVEEPGAAEGIRAEGAERHRVHLDPLVVAVVA